MGAKIINDKDFWICKGGLMPAPMQSTQPVAKKKDGTRFITINDKSTQSFVDFACSKLMWLMALIAAIIAVLVVATGGAALIAVGAIAGAAGAAYGAVLGSLICGQKAAMARQWLGNKSNLKVLGTPTVTGDHKMLCSIFGQEISYAPQIKSWWQAISLGAANFIGGVLEGAMIGAAVGMGGALVKGGIAAFSGGGFSALGRSALQLAKALPGNLAKNFVSSWTTGFGLGLRGVMGAQHMMQQYGETGEASGEDFDKGFVAIETGTADSARRMVTGQGTAMDFIGLALMFAPVHEATRRNKSSTPDETISNPDGENTRDAETRSEETARNNGEEARSESPGKDGEAFEHGRISKELIDAVEAEAAKSIAAKQEAIKNGIATPKLSPCKSGVYDPVTGKTHFGENFPKTPEGVKAFEKFKAEASKVIKDRIKAREEAVAEAREKGEPIDPKHDPRIGGHSEVVALDKAIKAREQATGKEVTEADLSSFDLHNRQMPSNKPMNRCPNCAGVTNGVNVGGGHK